MEIQEEFGSFSKYIWHLQMETIINNPKPLRLSATTHFLTISTDLKKRGFKFVGSTVVYATCKRQV
jgi:DNA-3-methyladenine glycosylase I